MGLKEGSETIGTWLNTIRGTRIALVVASVCMTAKVVYSFEELGGKITGFIQTQTTINESNLRQFTSQRVTDEKLRVMIEAQQGQTEAIHATQLAVVSRLNRIEDKVYR